MKYFVLRQKNENPEGDKYAYHISTIKGVERTTPFKDKATVYNEFSTVSVLRGNEWKFIRVSKPKIENL